MITRPRSYRLLPLLIVGAVLCSLPAGAQPSGDPAVAPVRASLAQPKLWGRDYPLLIASIPGWARIGEKTIFVAPDVIYGGTPFHTREEAEKRAEELRRALAGTSTPLSPEFARIAEQARGAVAEKVGVHRYGLDNSYRVIVGMGLDLIPPELRVVEVQRLLDRQGTVRREVEDGGGEHRPVVFTGVAWSDGALIYQTSNYAPTPGQVVRVVLSTPVALRAVTEKP
jgi:hypothetical protein